MKNWIVFILIMISFTRVKAQYQHDSVQVDGGYLHYYVKGSGEPLFLLQGGPGFSSYYMRAIADSLPEYQCVLIDYCGTGLSQFKVPDTSWVSTESMLKDVETVRAHLGFKKIKLLGHSYGTQLAMYYAVRYPKNVLSLTFLACIEPNNRFQLFMEDFFRMRLSDEDYENIGRLAADSSLSMMEKDFLIQEIYLKGYFFDKKLVPVFLNSFPPEEMDVLFNPLFFGAFVSGSSFMSFDCGKEFLKTKVPVRILQGRQDFVNTGQQDVMAYRLKNGSIEYMEKCGHFPWIEQPAIFFSKLKLLLSE